MRTVHFRASQNLNAWLFKASRVLTAEETQAMARAIIRSKNDGRSTILSQLRIFGISYRVQVSDE